MTGDDRRTKPGTTKLGVTDARPDAPIDTRGDTWNATQVDARGEPRGDARSSRARRGHADQLGQVVLERYRIEAVLGAGATGTVFRGRHLKLGRCVAIKILHDEAAAHPKMLARFRREAEAAGRLHHPNLSGVLDLGETCAGAPLIVMDLVEGPSLRAVMDAAAPITWAGGDGLGRARIIHLVRHILHGLDHAHAAGLVHRDLKPDNVIVERNDHDEEVPRIVDFGIAALCTDQAATTGRLTDTGALLGTPLYMAPEQARGEPVDQRADLFALGIMLYEMLSGTTPFAGSALEIVVSNMNEDVPPIARRAPAARPDPTLVLFMARLVARDPARRFATALAALALLEVIEHDPDDAQVQLGQIDVARALAVVALPR